MNETVGSNRLNPLEAQEDWERLREAAEGEGLTANGNFSNQEDQETVSSLLKESGAYTPIERGEIPDATELREEFRKGFPELARYLPAMQKSVANIIDQSKSLAERFPAMQDFRPYRYLLEKFNRSVSNCSAKDPELGAWLQKSTPLITTDLVGVLSAGSAGASSSVVERNWEGGVVGGMDAGRQRHEFNKLLVTPNGCVLSELTTDFILTATYNKLRTIRAIRSIEELLPPLDIFLACELGKLISKLGPTDVLEQEHFAGDTHFSLIPTRENAERYLTIGTELGRVSSQPGGSNLCIDLELPDGEKMTTGVLDSKIRRVLTFSYFHNIYPAWQTLSLSMNPNYSRDDEDTSRIVAASINQYGTKK